MLTGADGVAKIDVRLVPSALADPVLKIVDGNGVEVATNDNWKLTQQSAIFETGLAPTKDLEAAYAGQFAVRESTVRNRVRVPLAS
jgi:hypothetical protein